MQRFLQHTKRIITSCTRVSKLQLVSTYSNKAYSVRQFTSVNFDSVELKSSLQELFQSALHPSELDNRIFLLVNDKSLSIDKISSLLNSAREAKHLLNEDALACITARIKSEIGCKVSSKIISDLTASIVLYWKISQPAVLSYINVITQLWNETSTFTPMELSSGLSGLQQINVDSDEIEQIVITITTKVLTCQEAWKVSEMEAALTGLRNMNQKCEYVQECRRVIRSRQVDSSHMVVKVAEFKERLVSIFHHDDDEEDNNSENTENEINRSMVHDNILNVLSLRRRWTAKERAVEETHRNDAILSLLHEYTDRLHSHEISAIMRLSAKQKHRLSELILQCIWSSLKKQEPQPCYTTSSSSSNNNSNKRSSNSNGSNLSDSNHSGKPFCMTHLMDIMHGFKIYNDTSSETFFHIMNNITDQLKRINGLNEEDRKQYNDPMGYIRVRTVLQCFQNFTDKRSEVRNLLSAIVTRMSQYTSKRSTSNSSPSNNNSSNNNSSNNNSNNNSNSTSNSNNSPNSPIRYPMRKLTGLEITNSLLGLRNMSSDCSEVRRAMHIILKHWDNHKQSMSAAHLNQVLVALSGRKKLIHKEVAWLISSLNRELLTQKQSERCSLRYFNSHSVEIALAAIEVMLSENNSHSSSNIGGDYKYRNSDSRSSSKNVNDAKGVINYSSNTNSNSNNNIYHNNTNIINSKHIEQAKQLQSLLRWLLSEQIRIRSLFMTCTIVDTISSNKN